MTRVDAHLHVWRAAASAPRGISTIVSPTVDVPLEFADETLREHDIDRAVLVQPLFEGEENGYVARCAQAMPERLAAVCIVDPRKPSAAHTLEHWAGQGCRGLRLRPRVAAEEVSFGARETFSLWEAAERLGIVVNLLADPRHAPATLRMAERFAGVPIVVDHMGHPEPSAAPEGDSLARWLLLAKLPNVFLKLSGFYHFSKERYPFAECRTLIRASYEHFGPSRLLWGSDFPHVLLSCGYANSVAIVEETLADLPAAEREQIFGGNALRLYWPTSVYSPSAT